MEEARRQLDVIEKCEKEMKSVEEHIRDYIIESMADIRRQERRLIQNIANAYGDEGANFIRDKDYLNEVNFYFDCFGSFLYYPESII